jgi:hypothetical protein
MKLKPSCSRFYRGPGGIYESEVIEGLTSSMPPQMCSCNQSEALTYQILIWRIISHILLNN